MELNELRDLTKGVTAPTGMGSDSRSTEEALEKLVVMLETEDARDRKRAKRMLILFTVLSVLYGSIFVLTWILPPDGPAALSRISLALFTLLFLAIGLVSRRRWRELSAKEYRKPAAQYLDQEERRYRFIDTGELVFVVPFLVILFAASGLGWMNGISRYSPDLPPSIAIGALCLLWVCALLVGFHHRKVVWKRTKAPIWEAVKNIKSELTKQELSPGGK